LQPQTALVSWLNKPVVAVGASRPASPKKSRGLPSLYASVSVRTATTHDHAFALAFTFTGSAAASAILPALVQMNAKVDIYAGRIPLNPMALLNARRPVHSTRRRGWTWQYGEITEKLQAPA
jgi:hypothetical protein